MRGEALDGERPGDADLLLVVVGLVVEIFELGFGGDGGVDFLLAGDALLPPFRVEFLRAVRATCLRLRGGFPILPISF